MMAGQLYWEKSQGNLELYFAAPDEPHVDPARDGRRRARDELPARGGGARISTLVFGVTFQVDQWLL